MPRFARETEELVPSKTPSELGRIVESREIARFASRKCGECFGGGICVLLRKLPDGGEQRVETSCGCARPKFLKANRGRLGYDPAEPETPVHWLKGEDPRESPTPRA